MATTNGTLTPPSLPAPSPSVAKRKRSDTEHAPNGASTPVKSATGRTSRSLQAVLEDVLEILKGYDTVPSILDRPITSSTSRTPSGEAVSKRAKLTVTTVANLVQNGSYPSLAALEEDVETATSEILATIETDDLSRMHVSSADSRLQTRVLAFREMLRSLTAREGNQRPHAQDEDEGAGTPAEKQEDSNQAIVTNVNEEAPESRTVLTLFGQAQGVKQLFSSLQQPQRISTERNSISDLDTSVKLLLPLRESSLPNFINTTEVLPIPPASDRKPKRAKTMGDAFPRPSGLQPLSPPKISKPLTTRGNTITFVQHDTLPKTNRKGSQSYATQSLSTGHWLGYGGVEMPKDPTSPTAKQKSRQRALSTGEAQLPPSGATLEAVQKAKEEALFRSAYSSFAPSRDDAAAIVPEETKNMVWWQKVGEKRFNDTFPVDPALLDLDKANNSETRQIPNEDEDFKVAVENFVTDDNPLLKPQKQADLEKETEEILQEISDLIETLASHQRIRNSSLSTNPRTPVIQNPSLASLAGSPSSPSSEEADVYQVLKLQLTLLVSQLPPYAVAKLNGDQLDELNISRTILIDTKNYNGTLEEDSLSRPAKSTAVASAAPPSTLTRMGSSGTASHSHYPQTNQYPRSTSSLHSASAAARPVQTPSSFYPQQPSIHRSPSIQYQRSSSGPTPAFQSSTASYGKNPQLPTYSASQAYGQQTPRASYTSATPGQYYPSRPAGASAYGGIANSSQYFQPPPLPPSQTRYPSQTVTNGYYQRPQNVASSYNYNSASPLKGNSTPQPSYNSSRSAFGTPTAGSYYPQPGLSSANHYSTPQSSTPAAVGYGGIGSSHQQMLQSQAAAQSQARMAAQNSFISRQGSGTPQPPTSLNGGQPRPSMPI
ncbi:hypothetical protein EJ04DRAFT_573970 [Polyplosphaeria fusca]|uniref:Uncharacterized protein n=1 Tax=Polyplosphaeria fusca TaxID=682080 RepID=A0A9P4R881_9PLEO|nr:hypothetical protein EJ04DRAFT_573970 [Polyplosphaeria fusca]